MDARQIEAFRKTSAEMVADFCLEHVPRAWACSTASRRASSDPALRRRACDVRDFFVDVPYEGEIVRARVRDGVLELHEGGDSY